MNENWVIKIDTTLKDLFEACGSGGLNEKGDFMLKVSLDLSQIKEFNKKCLDYHQKKVLK